MIRRNFLKAAGFVLAGLGLAKARPEPRGVSPLRSHYRQILKVRRFDPITGDHDGPDTYISVTTEQLQIIRSSIAQVRLPS